MEDYNDYIVLEETSDSKAKYKYWQIAIGLQKVDNLNVSEKLKELALKNINNELTYQQVEDELIEYYNSKIPEVNDYHYKEADFVSRRIVEKIDIRSFNLSYITLKEIHEFLFNNILKNTNIPIGVFRKYNISKRESVLNGGTVLYDHCYLIEKALDYYITKEMLVEYKSLSNIEKVRNIEEFIANIWKVHPFGEGNTRTIAVFLIKYLYAKGYKYNEMPFIKSARYFRDALVLKTTSSQYQASIYLDRFFDNLLLNKNYKLEIEANVTT